MWSPLKFKTHAGQVVVHKIKVGGAGFFLIVSGQQVDGVQGGKHLIFAVEFIVAVFNQFVLSHAVDVLAGGCGVFCRLVGVVGAAMDGQGRRVTVNHVRHDADHDSRDAVCVRCKMQFNAIAGVLGIFTHAVHTAYIGQYIAGHLCAEFGRHISNFQFVHGKSFLSVSYGHAQKSTPPWTVGGSTVHIRQQHVVDHLQNVHRDALAVLQGSFDTGNVLCTSCIVVVRLPAARAVWIVLHGFTFFPVRL
nr:MAG TPA: hypothetical protein [Caudoviricetes sp.]